MMQRQKASRPILIADDLSIDTPEGLRRSKAVEAQAVALAQALGAPITAIHVETPGVSLAGAAFYHQQRPERMNRIVRSGSGDPIRRVIISGVPATEILKLASKPPRPLLVAMGTRERRGLRKLLLGSVAEEVIMESRLPVLVLGPRAQELPRRNPFIPSAKPKLLVATDLSPTNRRVERLALELALRLGASVTLFHSPYNERGIYRKLGVRLHPNRDLMAEVRRLMERRVERFAREGIAARVALDTETVFVPDAILQAAHLHTMVVIGTHSRSPLTRAFIGSAARSVILGSRVPVLAMSLRR